MLKSDGTTQNYLYLQRDYQGSIVAISDASGQVLEKRLFDAWGNVLAQDGAGNTLSGLTILDRGYTGHEHLQSVGLIHMNGRLYDAKLHRFLQPDNHVQEPDNTQSFNRYAYCVNNPFKYTDKDGEFFIAAIIVGAVIGGYIGGSKANKNWNPTKWDWSSGKTWAGIGTGALIGAIGGEVVGAGLAGGQAFGLFTVTLKTGIAIPSVGVFGISKAGDYFGTEFTNPYGQTFNQNIGTVPVVKPKSDSNGGGKGKGGNFLDNLVQNTYGPVSNNVHNFYGVPVKIIPEFFGGGSYFAGSINVPRSIWEGYKNEGLNSWSGRFLMHEYGHFLQEKYNPIWYNVYAAPSSFFNAIFNNQTEHAKHWAEIQASTYAYYYFGFPKGFDKENEVNSNYLSLTIRNSIFRQYLKN
ncbi:RHS repeat-associated core domain-containing protein [Flavobacterium sp. FZUC8N2.13]|uniref:RHS repeat-associated core domain-containing protein n=1 Tax=Flavobacterium zubiriense TaxID=3138075 RepID=A0ABV4TES1_9FLAO